MFKLFVSMILILACGALGLVKGQTYTQRLRELQQIKDMIQLLKTEIHYRQDPLPVIFQRLSGSRNSLDAQILELCKQSLEQKNDFKTSWETAINLASQNSCITASDKEILYDLGLQLGKSNVQGQLDLLNAAEQKLNLQLKDAEKQKLSKGKMYSGLGFSMGIIAAVLLI